VNTTLRGPVTRPRSIDGLGVLLVLVEKLERLALEPAVRAIGRQA